MEEYIKNIKRMLGEEKFAELSNILYAEVDKKYRKINIQDATEIVEFNLANILVIGIEKARGCKQENIEKELSWYNLGPRSFLLRKNADKFEANYSQYINLIIKKVQEEERLKKCNM